MDIGGGSVELARFRHRALTDTWSLPLGALRLSDRFLGTDPPTEDEADDLRRYVRRVLAEHEIRQLGSDEELIGTGGTIPPVAPRRTGHEEASFRLEEGPRVVPPQGLLRVEAMTGGPGAYSRPIVVWLTP